MHVKRGEVRIKTEEWDHLIVHASKVCMVGNVEALGCQLQFCLLANFMLPSQAHIEIGVVRAKSSVTAGSDRTFVGGVIVAVHLAACQQVERMSTVVGKNRSQLKAGKQGILPGAFNYAGRNDFMALIEFRKRAIGTEVSRILRSKIAVKISTRVEAFAKRVVANQSEGIAEVRRVDENRLKRSKLTAIGHIDPELCQSAGARAGGNASKAPRWRRCAADRPLRKQRLENGSRIRGWVATGHPCKRNDIDGDLAIAGTAAVTGEKPESSGKPADGVQIVHLTGLRRVTNRAVVRVPNSERIINSWNLVADCRVKDPGPATNHGLGIFEGIPGKGHTGAKILLVGIQRSVLRVKFVAKSVVQREIRLDGP